jgi:chromosome segregation ATPase
MSEHRSCLDVYRDYCNELEKKYRKAARLVSEREKEIIEIRGELHHSKKKNNSLQNELLNVKSEKAGINYFGTSEHIRLSSENVQLKAELDAHKNESSKVIEYLQKDIRRLLEEGGNLQKENNEYKQRVNMENVYKWQRDDLLKLSEKQDAEIQQLSKDRHDTERELMHAKKKIEELKEGNERLKRVEYALTGMVSGRDNQLLAFKASLSEARKGADESSQTHKRCEELQKELNRWKKACLIVYADDYPAQHINPEHLKKNIDRAIDSLNDKIKKLTAQLKDPEAGRALQSKIDRLKKGNQDLQAKLAQLELERAINKAPTPKFERAKDFIPFRFATSLEEFLDGKSSKLEQENERLKKDMCALRQDNEHFLKCNAEESNDIEFLEKWIMEFWKIIRSQRPYFIMDLPYRIHKIFMSEKKC